VFVDEPMVIAAEKDQVLQVGGSEVGPMFAMMGMDELSFWTAGKATASIPEPELAS
jgi:hypothetical protein